jgi:hypothetical protein
MLATLQHDRPLTSVACNASEGAVHFHHADVVLLAIDRQARHLWQLLQSWPCSFRYREVPVPGSIQVITSNKVDGRQVSFNLQVHLLQHQVQMCNHAPTHLYIRSSRPSGPQQSQPQNACQAASLRARISSELRSASGNSSSSGGCLQR